MRTLVTPMPETKPETNVLAPKPMTIADWVDKDALVPACQVDELSQLEKLALQDLEVLTWGYKQVGDVTRHLLSDHLARNRVQGKYGILRGVGLPLHETSVLEELRLLGHDVTNCCETYANYLAGEIRSLVRDGGPVEAIVIAVRTLKFLQSLGFCSSAWKRGLEKYVPDFERIDFNLARDTRDREISSYFPAYQAGLERKVSERPDNVPLLSHMQKWNEYLVRTGRQVDPDKHPHGVKAAWERLRLQLVEVFGRIQGIRKP